MDAVKCIKKFNNFLDLEYATTLESKERRKSNHIVIDFKKLARFDPGLSDALFADPEETLKAAAIAAQELKPGLPDKFQVRVKNIATVTKMAKIPISQIRSKHIGKLLVVDGMIKQKSDVRPQVTASRFECPSCGAFLNVLQLDDGKYKEPTKCGCGRKGKFRELSKETMDVFSLLIEEPAEYAMGAVKLCKLKILCRADLSNPEVERLLYQGGRVEVTGILKDVVIYDRRGAKSSKLDWYLDTNYVKIFDESFLNLKWKKEEADEFEKFATKKDWLQKLRESIFYDVHGYQEECEGVILQMFSGVGMERDGIRKRGSLHLLLIGDPGCIGQKELISCSDGSFKRAEAFAKNHLDPLDEYIFNHRTGPQDSYIAKAVTFFKYHDAPTKIITLATGKKIVCTYNHPLYIKRYMANHEWVKAEDMVVGDKVRVKTQIPCTVNCYRTIDYDGKQIDVDEDLALLMGYIHDGYVENNKVNGEIRHYHAVFIVNEEEIDLVKPISKIIKKKFDYDGHIGTRFAKNGVIEGRKIERTQTMTLINIHSVKFAEMMVVTNNKEVPAVILASKKSVVASYLAGMFEADGCIIVDKRRDRTDKIRVQLKSTHERLLLDVQALLLKFGIQARVNNQSLYIARTADVITYINEIGFVSEKKKTKAKKGLEYIQTKLINQRPRKQVVHEKIIKIEEGPVQDVYDIEVEKYHRYVVNGVVSHNSAKSTILKIAQQFSPKAMYVSGTSATATGLTGAVVRDELLGSFTLEAGPLVLCNNGVLMIDELDKLPEEHRNALHVPLENEIVTVAKANINATMIARTSVLAAANPKHGTYSEYETVFRQIEMSPTLINRFDLVYPIVDSKLDSKDHFAIAMKILARGQDNEEKNAAELSKDWIRKYIAYAKTITPLMSTEIQEILAKKYVKIKELKKKVMQEGKSAIPVTARNVDGFRRLVEAVARSRLHREVTMDDAERGYNKAIYSIKQVGIDPDSGLEVETMEIDGKVKYVEKKDIVSRVSNVVRELSKNRTPVDAETVVEILEKEGFERHKVDEILEKLRRDGDIMESSRGKYMSLP